jgi:hypothetical protein
MRNYRAIQEMTSQGIDGSLIGVQKIKVEDVGKCVEKCVYFIGAAYAVVNGLRKQ